MQRILESSQLAGKGFAFFLPLLSFQNRICKMSLGSVNLKSVIDTLTVYVITGILVYILLHVQHNYVWLLMVRFPFMVTT